MPHQEHSRPCLWVPTRGSQHLTNVVHSVSYPLIQIKIQDEARAEIVFFCWPFAVCPIWGQLKLMEVYFEIGLFTCSSLGDYTFLSRTLLLIGRPFLINNKDDQHIGAFLTEKQRLQSQKWSLTSKIVRTVENFNFCINRKSRTSGTMLIPLFAERKCAKHRYAIVKCEYLIVCGTV